MVGCDLSPDLPKMASAAVVGADEIELGYTGVLRRLHKFGQGFELCGTLQRDVFKLGFSVTDIPRQRCPYILV